jgi:hypothetical protein
LLTGVVLTLAAVLAIHLLFTANLHYSLSPSNCALQLAAILMLLISLSATMQVVLSSTFTDSEKWPYMISYIAVNVPPLGLDANTVGWSTGERAIWLVMTSCTSVLIQVNIYLPCLFG